MIVPPPNQPTGRNATRNQSRRSSRTGEGTVQCAPKERQSSLNLERGQILRDLFQFT